MKRLIVVVIGTLALSIMGGTNKIHIEWTEAPMTVHYLLGKTNMNNPEEPGWTLQLCSWHRWGTVQRQVEVGSLQTGCRFFTMCTGEIGWFTNEWYWPNKRHPVTLTITNR